jgi:hypothetical protein
MTRLTRTAAIAGCAVLASLACHAATTRPTFPPVTGATQGEIELPVKEATEALADVLRGDSLPLTRVEPRDGFLETAWFNATTHHPTHARRLGSDVVQVRAWINPSRQGYSRMYVETVYRPLADPSRAARDLERQAPPEHPVAARMTVVVTELIKLYDLSPKAGADSAGTRRP